MRAWCSRPHLPHSQEGREQWWRASSLHLHRPGSPSIKQPAAQWTKLSSLINAVEIISHGHAQRSISQVSLYPVKLTPGINCHIILSRCPSLIPHCYEAVLGALRKCHLYEVVRPLFLYLSDWHMSHNSVLNSSRSQIASCPRWYFQFQKGFLKYSEHPMKDNGTI